ncbi:hypothetical protein [Burkholderia pseudomallei]|uniref:hypothetical protein n=1 Tax=Burkholderia pseudomallei TaxID=28450 RepID=UPI000F578562|nr:hypothetical protein EGT86_21360 [Burkholderia pseudomallei]
MAPVEPGGGRACASRASAEVRDILDTSDDGRRARSGELAGACDTRRKKRLAADRRLPWTNPGACRAALAWCTPMPTVRTPIFAPTIQNGVRLLRERRCRDDPP